MKKPSLKVLASALSLAIVGATAPVSANHSWGGYHWARTSNPFTLELGDNVSGAWDAILGTTSSDWTASVVLNTTIVPGATTPKRCRATSGRVEVCNASYGRNGWLGLASVWISGGHIVQGTTKVNDTYFSMAAYNTPAWRNLVMCQEVGHTFGLAHQDENFNNANLGSCMDYTNDPNTNQHPNQHDYDQLASMYDHPDSTTTVVASGAQMPNYVAEHDSDHRSGWGKLIRASKDGLRETYLLDFGQGYRIFRFVIWAEGEGRGRRDRH